MGYYRANLTMTSEIIVTVIADNDEEAAKKIFEEIGRVAAEHTAENVSYDIDSIERVG